MFRSSTAAPGAKADSAGGAIAQAVDIPLPETVAGFVGVRLGRLAATIGELEGGRTLAMMRLERLCGLQVTHIDSLCFARRAPDGRRAMLISGLEPIAVEANELIRAAVHEGLKHLTWAALYPWTVSTRLW